jgi:hypothetical protein
MNFKKILFILFLVILFLALIWKFNVFSIEKIDVISNIECACKTDLEKDLNFLNITFLDLKSSRINKLLKEKYLCIQDVSIEYSFPRVIKVTVYGRKFFTKVFPLNKTLDFIETEASVSSETALIDWSFPEVSSGDALVADDMGYIFVRKPDDFPLPKLFMSENLKLGGQLDLKKIRLIKEIFDKYYQIEQISLQPSFKAKILGNTLLINSSTKIAFSLERDILRQLASLQLILQKAKIDQRPIEIIDLRFDKPVVEYQQKLSK